jgi:hypothetical protein
MAGNTKQKYAVEKYGVNDKVLKLYKEGVSATKISTALKKEDNVFIAPHGINRYLKKFKEIDESKSNLEEVKKFEAVVIDYKLELTSILDEVKSVKNKMLEDGDYKMYEKLVGRLYQGIQLIGEFMGDIKQKNSVDINVVINEISKRSFLDNKDGRSFLKQGTVIDVESEIEEDDERLANELRN